MTVMKLPNNVFIYFMLIIFLIPACKSDKKTEKKNKHEITIFAAASLNEVLLEIVNAYKSSTDVKVRINLASSGTLARQIDQGNIADVFLSASKEWTDYLRTKNHIYENNIKNFGQNELVVITYQNCTINNITIDSTLNFINISNDQKISMGDPLHVPAGKYAKQALQYFGWYNHLEKRILPAKDVRTALMVVEMGETGIGIVYKTDAIMSKKVRIIGTFPENSHDPIKYYAALIRKNSDAKEFYNFLSSEKGKEIFKKYGFKTN